MNEYTHECREVAYFMRRLYRQMLTTTSGGNISCRLPAGAMAITPAKIDKARIRTAQIAIITADRKNLTPDLAPSMETEMHAAIYAARADVQAIVHAHPTTATAFTATHTPIRCDLIAESYALLATPVVASYALMGTPELAGIVAREVLKGDVVLLENHGVIAVGDSLLRAFDRLELIEAAARMNLIVKQLNEFQPLDGGRKRELDRMMGR